MAVVAGLADVVSVAGELGKQHVEPQGLVAGAIGDDLPGPPGALRGGATVVAGW